MSDVMQPATGQMKQMAMVFDLNKCMGCQACSVGCKVLWTQEEGEEHQWWMTVNTQPGKGTPKDWEDMGGGLEDGKPVPGQPARSRRLRWRLGVQLPGGLLRGQGQLGSPQAHRDR